MNDIMAAHHIDINYKLLIDKVPNPIITTDETGEIIYLNDAARLLGAVKGEKIWNKPFVTSNINTTESFNSKLKEDGKIVLSVSSSDKQSFSFDLDVAPIYDDNYIQSYLYALSNQQNITAPISETDKYSAPSIGEFTQKEFQNLMVEKIEDYAILMLDKKGTIVNWNKGAQNIKGYSASEIIGFNFEMFYSQQDRNAALPQSLLLEATTQGKAKNEGWRLRKDGSRFWAYVVITALHDKNGDVIGFTKVTRDLTERKIAEEQREQQTRDIEAKNRQLEEFAYITSHDLQEPIRKIQIFTQLIENNIGDKNHTENYLHKISAASLRMGTLIKGILEYARLLQKNDDLQKTDLNDVLEGVRDDLELLISERNVDLRVLNPLPVLPAVRIHMQQLFTNLINNAIKFSGSGPVIEISSHSIDIENDNARLLHGRYNCLKFKDNGIGFEQKYAEEIFKPFKRLISHAKGTGIGLAVCHKIVENHGGSIEVTSQPNAGTTFTIYLPNNSPDFM